MCSKFIATSRIVWEVSIKAVTMKKLVIISLLLTNIGLYAQDPNKKCISYNYHTTNTLFLITENTSPFIQKRFINTNLFSFNIKNCNYLAIYNKVTRSYDCYPGNVPINFNMQSPRVACQNFNPVNVDSFNPYGTHTPGTSIILGCFNLLLKKLTM